ncbi:MAG TPA: isoprenylcysteine carboxylmethyltransferase family protein [Candidatus Methanoperedens sp.]|nr:isoprenylcysteine carboxylmethyltransferase family protein [Candidatus Methanoperedens sp.]
MTLAERLQQRRVALGWVFAAAFAAFARPTPAAILAGAVPLVLGAAVRTWAAGHIRKGERLAVQGPYALTRNPLYFGSFLMACGALLMGRNPWLGAAFLLLAVPAYHVVIRKEEAESAARFGEAFADYCRAVPRFFPRPRLRLPRAAAAGSFDWELVLRNREPQAWAGAALLTLLLLARWYWLGRG